MTRLQAILAIACIGATTAISSPAEASITRGLSRSAFSIKASTDPDPFAAAPQLVLPSLTQEVRAIEERQAAAAECVALCDLAAGIEAHPFGVASAEPLNRSEDAWGNYRFTSELDTSHNRFGFTGHYWDKEASLYYAKARYYDPFTARFTQADSFLGKIDDPPSLHRYFYANYNPTMYVDENGNAATEVGATVGFVWGAGQAVGGALRDAWNGRIRNTSDYLSLWAQNTIGGAEIGASIDVGLFSGGLAASASGALGNAGFGALTFGGESAAWGEFGHSQLTDGAVGAALGPVLAKAIPVVGKALSLIPGAKTAGAWVAGKASQLAGSVAERFTVAESDAWITRSAGEQISALGGRGPMSRPTDPYSPNWSQYYADNPNAMRFGPGAMRNGELNAASSGPVTDPARLLPAGRPTTLTREQVARWRGTNQARGQVHGQHLAEFSGGRTEVGVDTALGRRIHDARAAQETLTELAFEGKNYLRWRTVGGTRVQGSVPPSAQIRTQIHKDVLWIREGRKLGIHRVSQWDFPGAPPSPELASLLERWGLPYVH